MTEEQNSNRIGTLLSGGIRKLLPKTAFYPIFGLVAGFIAILPLKYFYSAMTAGMLLLYSVFYVIILERLNDFTFIEDFRKKTNHVAATLLIVVKVTTVYLLFMRLSLFGETQLLYHILLVVPLIGWTAIMVEKDKKCLPFTVGVVIMVICTFAIFNAQNVLTPVIHFSDMTFNPVSGLSLAGIPLGLAILTCIARKAVFADTAALIGFLIIADRICYA